MSRPCLRTTCASPNPRTRRRRDQVARLRWHVGHSSSSDPRPIPQLTLGCRSHPHRLDRVTTARQTSVAANQAPSRFFGQALARAAPADSRNADKPAATRARRADDRAALRTRASPADKAAKGESCAFFRVFLMPCSLRSASPGIRDACDIRSGRESTDQLGISAKSSIAHSRVKWPGATRREQTASPSRWGCTRTPPSLVSPRTGVNSTD